MARKIEARVLNELDNVVLKIFSGFRPDGVDLTEQQKRDGLLAAKSSPGYKAIEKAIKRGSDADLKEVEQIVRERFIPGLRKPLLEAARRLPHPKGGRRKVLSEEQRVKARREIGELIGNQGCEQKDAVETAARRFNVSVRTMQRVWQERPRSKSVRVTAPANAESTHHARHSTARIENRDVPKLIG